MNKTLPYLAVISAFLLLGTGSAQAQTIFFGDGTSNYGGAPNYPVIYDFDGDLTADTTFWGHYGMTPDNDTDRAFGEVAKCSVIGCAPQSGADALWLDWGLFTDQSWGGSMAIQHILPDTSATGEFEIARYYDFSDFTHINLWYNVLVPAAPAAVFRIKMQDASEGIGSQPSSETEDWYMEDSGLFQSTPGWKMLSVPLESLGNVTPGPAGFSRPGCPGSCWSGLYGNGEFDLDKITGYQIEITGPQYGAVDDSTTTGTVLYDNFHVSGVRYNTLTSFEGAPTSEALQSNAGSYTVSTSADAILDAGALQLDYTVVGDQGWGGEVDLFFAPDGADNFGDMQARTAISVFYKVMTPASAGGTFGLRVHENSDGNSELWAFESTEVMTDASGQWRRFLVPFDEMTIPSWSTTHDGILDRSAITQIQFVFYTGEGSTTTGSILFDRMTGYGFQETDYEAPVAVTGVSAATGAAYENIVTWADVPGEDGESYNVYYSMSPITDVSAEGVYLLQAGVAEGTEVVVHPLYYPSADGSLTYYYAVSAKDRVGNLGAPGATAASVTNTARGLATISMSSPAFVADGDLSEFASITPIHIEAGTPIGHVASGFADPSDAADFSADARIAIDSDYIYVGIMVSDQTYDPMPSASAANPWMYDGAELNIGLYDGRSGKHANYNVTDMPDYKFSMYGAWMANDQGRFEADNGTEAYYTGAVAGGWVVEARIPLADLNRDGFEKFVPQNGMWIPLDIVLFDDDTAPGGENRETILAYSPYNNDNSWSSPNNWFYTWIGDQFSVGVETVSTEVPMEYSLQANYPNPFNPVTTFRYDVAQSGNVALEVYNMLGQRVAQVVNRAQAAGTYEVQFDASHLSSGVYLYTLSSGGFIQTRKMTLLR